MKSGLDKIQADKRDLSLIHSLKAGAVYGASMVDPNGLPETFSIYDGRIIQNQNQQDTRFNPFLPPLAYGCTAETGTTDAGIQDTALYDPQDMYLNTPGEPGAGRDMRLALSTLKVRGPRRADGTFGPKRPAYFNCYAAGSIDDYDAVKIAIWINQFERRGVWVGSWWYPEFAIPDAHGILSTPSFNMNQASLHAHLITGWKTINGIEYLESLSWQGMDYGDQGRVYFSREIYNALMQQPYTGAFTQTKLGANAPIPIGYKAVVDQFIYWFRNTFHV